jgi:AraC-like DNA-binding protein
LPALQKTIAFTGAGALLAEDFFSLRISTDMFSGKDRAEAFREHLGKTILRVEMEPIDTVPFDIDLTLSAVPGFGMATGSVSPIRNRHTSRLIDNDDVVIVFLTNGAAMLDRNGHSTGICKGDAVLTMNDEVATFAGITATRTVNLRFNRNRLGHLLEDDFSGKRKEPKIGDSVALQLLRQYASVIESGTALESAETRQLAVEHLYDLASLAIGADRDSRPIANQRGLRAARLHAVQAGILKNLGNRELSASAIALRHGISQRYMQMLFETTGITFTEFVLDQRLKRAHRMLSDPRCAAQNISSIAFEVGFNDLSYFNRTFRRMFGATPSDIRNATKS